MAHLANYGILTSSGNVSPTLKKWSSRYYLQYLVLRSRVVLFSITILAILSAATTLGIRRTGIRAVASVAEVQEIPCLYPEWREAERRLPQHNKSLPFPEGDTGRYIYFASQVIGAGFGNTIQEILVNNHLAYLSGRSFVFSDYVWNVWSDDPWIFEWRYNRTIASRVPLSAFLSGPSVGAPWPPGDPAPRSVIHEYWEQVCPKEVRIELDVQTEEWKMGIQRGVTEGGEILEKWAKYLRDMPERCVYFEKGKIFDIPIFISSRIVSVWRNLAVSPTLAGLRWSDVVLGGAERNMALFGKPSAIDKTKLSISGVVAIHVRRGDFQGICPWLVREQWSFCGWNALPELPDRWTPVPSDAADYEEKLISAQTHCWPSIGHMTTKLESLRRENPNLDTVYILSNMSPEWLGLMRGVLLDDGWKKIVTTAERTLIWEEAGLEQAVDMEIAARAEVFVGVGYSSYSSHITLLRLTRGHLPESIRFW